MDVPLKFPATATDRCLAFIKELGNTNLNLEMIFTHHLDEKRLSKAIELLFEAEPILKCRFIFDKWNPYWKRIESTKKNFIFTTDENELEKFRAEILNISLEQGFRACLLRKANLDHLLLKIAHDICDAGGCKHLSLILSKIYSKLSYEPDYKPIPNIKGSRGVFQILKNLPLKAYPKIYLNYLKHVKRFAFPIGCLSLPASCERGSKPYISIYHLKKDIVEKIKEFGERYNATINDVFMAAFLKALVILSDWDKKTVLRLTYTVDLRRHYLNNGLAEGLCNLSGFEHLNFGTNLGDDFLDTLKKVTIITRSRKANYFGLSDYIGGMPTIKILPFKFGLNMFRLFIRHGIKNKNVHNMITNMGPIDTECVTFDLPADNAWIVTPAMYPPVFGIGFTGHNGSLTLSAGTYPPGITKEVIDKLFEIIKELIQNQLCKLF